eukprot:gene4187-4968_t
MRGDKPVVKIDGSSRAFTWNFVEPEGGKERGKDEGSDDKKDGKSGKICVGDKVRVRDREAETWKNGTVVDMRGDKHVVKLGNTSRGFTWEFIELLASDKDQEKDKGGKSGFATGDKAVAEAKPTASGGGAHFRKGDNVRVRDSDRDRWQFGAVTEIDGGKVWVQVEGSRRQFTWKFVEED